MSATSIPDTGINQELLVGMQITTQIAGAQNRKEKLQLFIKLICTYYMKGQGSGLIRRHRRILARRRDLQETEVKQLSRAKHAEKITHRVVTLVPIHHKAEIVLLGNSVLSDASIKAIAQLTQSFNLDVKSRASYALIPFILIALMFVPIKDKVSGKGIVIGEPGYTVSATSNGMIRPLIASSGRIDKGAAILEIETLIQGEIDAARITLQKINTQILEQGANSTENINLLLKQRRIA